MPVPVDEPLLAELWSRFKAGEEKAFDQLAELRYRVLFNYATASLKTVILSKTVFRIYFWNCGSGTNA